MFVQLIRFVFILVGAISGNQIVDELGWPVHLFSKNLAIIIYMILGAGVGYVLGGVFGRRLSRVLTGIEDSLQNIPMTDLILGIAGLVTGLVIAFLITLPFGLVQQLPLRFSLTAFTYAVFAWLGMRLGIGRRGEARQILNLNAVSSSFGLKETAFPDKLLDTNIIIDGRILDLLHTGFLEGAIVVPRFVLHELQAVADSEDALKRGRGRRGLDILNTLQTDLNVRLHISEIDYPDVRGVDAKLVRLARETGATVVTNDFNLAKVAQLEGVKILNLNDLANAVKTVLLPGEELKIKIVREGKEPGQGVGYLEDGAMVIVEEGQDHLGRTVELKVTSVLQTPAGRLIFAKMTTFERT